MTLRDVKDFFIRIHQTVRKWIVDVLFLKILVPILLTVLYVFVVGPTKLVVRVFLRNKVGKPDDPQATSQWQPATGYQEDLKSGLSQS